MGPVSTATETSTSFENAFRGYDYRTSVGMVRTTIEDGVSHLYRFNTIGTVVEWSASFSAGTPCEIESAALTAALDGIGYR